MYWEGQITKQQECTTQQQQQQQQECTSTMKKTGSNSMAIRLSKLLQMTRADSVVMYLAMLYLSIQVMLSVQHFLLFPLLM